MGSNGLTSARHDVFHSTLANQYPESFDPSIPLDLIYTGALSLTDKVEGTDTDAGKLVLSPTRTYAPILKQVISHFGKEIHGLVHCSGGGQTKVLHFLKNQHVVKDNLFALPPLFKMIHEQSGTDWKEMYQVFNMGHRMEVYCNSEIAEEVIRISKSFNVDAQIVGRVEAGNEKQLSLRTPNGEFVYN
jgi:phosphoribosylformylglycinamidine cyclo-ligase